MKNNQLILIALVLFTKVLSFGQAGALDISFGSGGKVSTAFEQYNSQVSSMVIQPDGKILAAGAAFDHEFNQFALARYNVDGTLDANFGIGGKVISNFSTSKMSLKAIALQSDGKIVGAGIIYNNFSDSQFVLVRYDVDGNLDTGFGVNGTIIGNAISINALLIQFDGKIIVSGFTFDDLGDRDIYVARYLEEGILDVDFGTDGFVTTSVGEKAFGYSLCQQQDGKLIVAGTSNSSGYYSDFVILRYSNGGTLDSTFGNNGVVLIDSDDSDQGNTLGIQTDGKIVIAGWSSAIDGSLPHYILARVLSNGTLDAGFGTAGKIIGEGAEKAKALGIQSDGKILIVGASDNSGDYEVSLSRFKTDGTADVTFGVDGTVTTPFSTSGEGNCVKLQDDGKIVIGGEAGTTGGTYSPDFAMLRYNSGVELTTTTFEYPKNRFSVYPNPVNQFLTIDFNLQELKELSMNLYDCNGREIEKLIENKQFYGGFNSQKIELPNLQKGVYYITVSDGKSVSNVKIIK